MGSEGAPELYYGTPGVYYAAPNFVRYDPNTGLNLTNEAQNMWSYGIVDAHQDPHYSGIGVQTDGMYYPSEYMYPQSYDVYQQYQFNPVVGTENPFPGSQIPQQSYLTNTNYVHPVILPTTTELGSVANQVYQPGSIPTMNYTNYANMANSVTSSHRSTGSVTSKTGPVNEFQKSTVQGSVPTKQTSTRGVLSSSTTPHTQVPNSSGASVKTSPLLSKPTGGHQLPPRNWTHPAPTVTTRSKPNPTETLTLKSFTSAVQAGDSQGNIVFNPSDYNKPEFPTEHNCAKFFVIKSYNEEDVHKSIKYGVWSSTPNGNRKLNAAYDEAQRIAAKNNGTVKCPIFLFFSVNGSGHFCGVAEMVGPVDFSKDVDLWLQDKWPGSFPVKWHIVKDVPNTTLRQVILENNEGKPVTHSRDTQEVLMGPGTSVLKIFKNSNAKESVLDDIIKYENMERDFHKGRTKLLSSDAPVFVPVSKKNQTVEKVDANQANANTVPKENPNPNSLGEKLDDKVEDAKKQENITVIKPSGSGNPKPNSDVKEPAVKPVGTKKENVTGTKANRNGIPNPSSGEKEPLKQVNGMVIKANKENGKVQLKENEKLVDKIGSLSINAKISEKYTGESSNQGQEVVTIGSMHVRVVKNPNEK